MIRAKTRKCKNCDSCKTLYRRFRYRANKDRLYYCTVREEMTELENSCSYWCAKKAECDLSKERFDETEKDILLIGKYLKDI